jgi:PhoD-like phosphatase
VSEPRPPGEMRLTKRQQPGRDERRESVPHKSPLQQLETTLSKEEKRARLEEAESLARERSVRKTSGADDGGGSRGDDRRYSARAVSGPERSSMPPPPIGQNRETKPKPDSGRVADYHAAALPTTTQASQPPPVPAKELPEEKARQRSHSGSDQYGPPARQDYAVRSRADPSYASPTAKQFSQIGRNAAIAGAATAGAAAGGYEMARSRGNKLQKNPPSDKRSSATYDSPTQQTYSGRRDRSDTDNGISPATVKSVYHTPPQNATSPVEHRGLGIKGSEPKAPVHPQSAATTDTGSQYGFHLPHLGTYQARNARHKYTIPTSDWRSIPTIGLRADDLDLMVAPESAGADQRAWWEKSSTEGRKSASGHDPKSSHYNVNYDDRTGQTFFRPPIYLKCGPLLRFRGIHRENVAVRSARSTNSSAAREIWKGSVMIVTIDRKSSYETAPTMRLFKQPMEMLPPPPQEIDEATGRLPPEYDDPIAGQVKISRVGKTLHVRPVEDLTPGVDLSRKENDKGLFEEKRTAQVWQESARSENTPHIVDGEQVGKVKEVRAGKLFAERGVTFWKFNIEIELGPQQQRIAYRINGGPATGFWVPAAGENMNIMFHSCNGFSLSVDPNQFSGPDPLWRDVLNTHQTRPFHIMIGGGDQIYMDAATVQTKLFGEWATTRNPHRKHHMEFSPEMQDELEQYYLDRYAMWFSSGFFGMANSQIPMVNIWDDHDILDGYGSYRDHTMESPVMVGIGAVAYKYYMLFQHQTVPEETESEEHSWILGGHRGPFIQQLSRSVFMRLGRSISLLGLDCRTERTRDDILSEESWERVFDRLHKDVIKGETKHLIVLLGIPIAYPRLNFLENVLTSRAMEPVKFVGRTGALGGFVNKFDGGVEVLDDLDDHWTAKHHKDERNWLIQELQQLAAEKSVRVTILGGDVHLCAVGQFFSNKKLGIAKDRDHRYMPNIISSAIVNTPPADMVADVLNRRNKIHHLDHYTDENMVPMFHTDVDGKPRNNKHLLPRRNWCSIREYMPTDTPPHTPSDGTVTPPPHDQPPTPYSMHTDDSSTKRPGTASSIRRSLSLTRRTFSPRAIANRLTGKAPPIAYYTRGGAQPGMHQRSSSADAVIRRGSQPGESGGSYFPTNASDPHQARRSFSSDQQRPRDSQDAPFRPSPFVRRPTDLSLKDRHADPHRGGHIDLEHGLDVRLNVENVRGEPEGTTTDYRLIVPALDFRDEMPNLPDPHRLRPRGLNRLFSGFRRGNPSSSVAGDVGSISGSEHSYKPATQAVSGPTGKRRLAAATGNDFDDDDDDVEERSTTPLGGWVDEKQHIPAPAADKRYSQPTGGVLRKPLPPQQSQRGGHLDVPPIQAPRVRESKGTAALPRLDTDDTRIADDSRPARRQYRARNLYDELDDSVVDDGYDDIPPAQQQQKQAQVGGDRWSGGGRRRRDEPVEEYGEDDWRDSGSPTQRESRNGGKRRKFPKFWKLGY